MTREVVPLQINSFSGGLNTELSPLQSSVDTTQDEINMKINRDGSRERRLGFNFENGYIENGDRPYNPLKQLATTMFKWENAGGDPEKSLLAVQVGNQFSVFDLDIRPISSSLIYSVNFFTGFGDDGPVDVQFNYTVIDGLLVMTTGQNSINIFEYENNTITLTFGKLKIRDLFGVQVPGYTEAENLRLRPNGFIPSLYQDRTEYNLRNQGFHTPYRNSNGETLQDPISIFTGLASGAFPSNSDIISKFIYADPNDTNNRTVERFFAQDMIDSPIGNSPAPKGFFIINALSRGVSRKEEFDRNEALYSSFSRTLITPGDGGFFFQDLGVDETPRGAQVVKEFSGRVWYAGFPSEIIDGDDFSPRLGSYLLFSRLVNDKTDITKCYQQADPTDREDNALVDTDGGFIRIDGAYNIKQLIPISNSLFIFAENGVWYVRGSEDSNFTATSYEVVKLTDRGCISGNSVVLAENSILYWGRDAIYRIARNELGIWESTDLTEQTLKTFYLNIPINNKTYCSGYYDSYQKEIRWVYTREYDTDGSKELIFHTTFNSFTKNIINAGSNNLPKIMAVSETEPYSTNTQTFQIFSNGEAVTVDGENVDITLGNLSPVLKETLYLVVTQLEPTIRYTLGFYRDNTFTDWVDLHNLDSGAYLIVNSFTGGEPRGRKSIPYLSTYFRRTESGFDANLNPLNPSSCLVSARWSWADNLNSGKWSPEREAYRYNKTYVPVDSSDIFELGYSVISTKNKLRGSGESVNLRFNSQPLNNMHIYGWAFNLENANED